MSLIYKCESCNEETVVERVVPGIPLKCLHCGRERPSGSNGTSLWWMDESPSEETFSETSDDNPRNSQNDG